MKPTYPPAIKLIDLWIEFNGSQYQQPAWAFWLWYREFLQTYGKGWNV